MNNMDENYENFKTRINVFIDFNEKAINQILHFLKSQIFILINNYKKFRHYSV